VTSTHLTQGQLAARWEVSESKLERWRCQGIGPVYMKLGGQVRYRLEDVEAFEARSLRSSPAQSAQRTSLITGGLQ